MKVCMKPRSVNWLHPDSQLLMLNTINSANKMWSPVYWVEESHRKSRDMVPGRQKGTLQKKTWGCWWTAWTRASSVPLKQKMTICIQGGISRNAARKLRKVILLLCSALVRPHSKGCVSFCVPEYKLGVGALEGGPAKGWKGEGWTEHPESTEERVRAVFVQPWDKRHRGDLAAICSHAVRGRGDGARCFL